MALPQSHPNAYIGCNYTIPQYNCTLETCCLAQSHFLYRPTLGGNLFFAILFAILIVPQIGLGIWYRTWGFMVAMALGLVLEVLGYVARVLIHDNPFTSTPFLLYLIALTIAPVFLSAAIYLCLTRIIGVYGSHLSRFRPRTIALTFMISDFASLLLQAIGGAIADTASTSSSKQAGVDIMIAGLVLQVISLAVFLLVIADFAWSARKGVLDMSPEKQRVRNSLLFKAFGSGLLLATVAILIRSIFRVVELWQGFSGTLWNSETDFLVLDGAMVSLAVLCLTLLHPGVAFGRAVWQDANWTFRTQGKEGVELRKARTNGLDSES